MMAMSITETVGAVVVLLLAVYGCVQGIRWMVLRLVAPPRDARGMWLLPLAGHREDVEYLVRTAAARCRWEGAGLCDVYVVDAGADEETHMLARRTCDAVSGIRFVDAEDMPSFLTEWAQ